MSKQKQVKPKKLNVGKPTVIKTVVDNIIVHF